MAKSIAVVRLFAAPEMVLSWQPRARSCGHEIDWRGAGFADVVNRRPGPGCGADRAGDTHGVPARRGTVLRRNIRCRVPRVPCRTDPRAILAVPALPAEPGEGGTGPDSGRMDRRGYQAAATGRSVPRRRCRCSAGRSCTRSCAISRTQYTAPRRLAFLEASYEAQAFVHPRTLFPRHPHLPPLSKTAKSVTRVSGTECHPCLRPFTIGIKDFERSPGPFFVSRPQRGSWGGRGKQKAGTCGKHHSSPRIVASIASIRRAPLWAVALVTSSIGIIDLDTNDHAREQNPSRPTVSNARHGPASG